MAVLERDMNLLEPFLRELSEEVGLLEVKVTALEDDVKKLQ